MGWWGGGGGGGVGEWREEGRQHALFQPNHKVSGAKRDIKRKIYEKREESVKICTDILFPPPSVCLQPHDSFPHSLLFLSGPGRRLPLPLLPLAFSEGSTGWNPISTPPFAFQQSFQSLALDSALWSGFRPLMNSDDADKRWWHSLTSGTRWWSLEFLMT